MKLSLIITLMVISACAYNGAFSRSRYYGNNTSRIATTEDQFGGVCSYYGQKFHGKKTASGEVFDMYALTAAHPSLPFGTKLEILNVANNKKVIVIVNDRGPFVKNRVLDLSYAAADEIDMIKTGTAEIVAKVIYKPEIIYKPEN